MNILSHVLTLSLAYALVTVILLLILVKIQISYRLKVLIIAAASVFYGAVFIATKGILGWAAPSALPDRFELLWGRVIDPNPAQNDPGNIYVWVEALDASNIPSGIPRAYVLPYSTALSQRIEAAQSELKKGRRLEGRAQRVLDKTPDQTFDNVLALPTNIPVAVGGDPSGGTMFDPSFLGGQSKMVDLFQLPPPSLPPKDLPQ